MIYRRIPQTLSCPWAITIGLAIITILLPIAPHTAKDSAWFIWTLGCIIGSGYALFAATHLIIQGRTGAVPAFIGIICFVALTPTHLWPNGLWHHYNIQIGTLVFRYCLLLSVLLRVTALQRERRAALEALVSNAEDAKLSIGRELHDGVGQNLAAAKLHVSLFEGVSAQRLRIIKHELEAALISLRRAINGYGDRLLQHNSLFDAIALDAKRLQLIYPVTLQVQADSVQFDERESEQLFRIFQESCANAINHGRADKIWVQAETTAQGVRFLVGDNGRWKPPLNNVENGHGRHNSQARAESIGATMEFSYGPMQDTVVSVILPR